MQSSKIEHIKIKKIALFLNASSHKLAGFGAYKDGIYNSRQSGGLMINWCLEFSLFKLLQIHTAHLASIYIKLLLTAPFIVHLIIDIIFSKDLKQIENDYRQYYGSYYYITYCVLAVTAVIYALYYIFYIW